MSKVGTDVIEKRRKPSVIYTRTVTDKMVQRGISFPPELLEKIDEMRGSEPRSYFVCRMLEEYFAAKSWIIADTLKREKR